MKIDRRILKRQARQIREAAQAIIEIDSDLIHSIIDDGYEIPMPQNLFDLADKLENKT